MFKIWSKWIKRPFNWGLKTFSFTSIKHRYPGWLHFSSVRKFWSQSPPEYSEDYEFTKFDIVPKQEFTQADLLSEQNNETEDKNIEEPLNIYQSLIFEVVQYLKSNEFYKEFAPFVQNNDTFIKLLCLHISMLTHSLMNNNYTPPDDQGWKKRLSANWEIRKATFVMNSCKYPTHFLSFLYQQFHSHLPEELFYEDFVEFFQIHHSKISKQLQKYLKNNPNHENSEKLREIITKYIVEKDEEVNETRPQFDADHPLVQKLELYILAHLKYLDTLDIDDIVRYKVHWGLRKVKKLTHQEHTESDTSAN